MSKPKGTEKLKVVLKQEAQDKVPAGKPDPAVLKKILKAAEDAGNDK